MTKRQMAEIIVRSPAWNGYRTAQQMCKYLTKEEIEDIYEYLDIAEQDYYENH